MEGRSREAGTTASLGVEAARGMERNSLLTSLGA